jgi:hypothetical protein
MRAGGWTDRQIDTTKQTVAFRNFANAPKMYKKCEMTKKKVKV